MSFLTIATLSIDICVILVAVSGHLFILLVNTLDAAKSRLHLGDRLICNISVLNISYLILNIFETVFLSLGPIKVSIEVANQCFLILYLTFCSSNIWFSSWLFVYYCVTIVKINQRFYIYLQKIFPKVLTWILIFTVLQSFVFSFFSVWPISKPLSSNASIPEYGQRQSLKMYYLFTHHINVYTSTFSVSFMVLYIPALTIIFFLYKHMNKMKDNAEAANVEAHVRAIRTILFLLAVNTLKLLAGINWFLIHSLHIYEHVAMIFSAANSLFLPLVLIKANTKLNKAFRGFLQSCFPSK